jgi:hypothetical protein
MEDGAGWSIYMIREKKKKTFSLLSGIRSLFGRKFKTPSNL